GPRVSDSQAGVSYYEITGVSPGQDYLVGLSDAAGIQVSVYGSSSFSSPLPCDNIAATQRCALTAPGASLFVAVRSFDLHGRLFVLNVHEAPIDEGSFSTPLALGYPASFPY